MAFEHFFKGFFESNLKAVTFQRLILYLFVQKPCSTLYTKLAYVKLVNVIHGTVPVSVMIFFPVTVFYKMNTRSCLTQLLQISVTFIVLVLAFLFNVNLLPRLLSAYLFGRNYPQLSLGQLYDWCTMEASFQYIILS